MEGCLSFVCTMHTYYIMYNEEKGYEAKEEKISQTIGNRMEFSIKGISISNEGEPTKFNFFSQLFWDQDVVEKDQKEVPTACMS